MITIHVSDDERLLGAMIGARRKMTSDARRAKGDSSRRPEHYEEVRTWDQEIEATIAEIATAIWRNTYWTGAHFNGTSGADAGSNQVRWTQGDRGHLIVYPEDADNVYFVLVTGRSPDMHIVGWCLGLNAKQDVFWREPPEVLCASWWVPQEHLTPAK